MKNFVKCLQLILILATATANAQPKKITGVYAGIEIMPSAVMGGGMSRSDEALLLRPDGTFNNDLGKPDWQERITGTYTVSGNQLSLRFSKNNKVITHKFDEDGNLDAGGYNLIKQPVDNSVPKGYFKFSRMNSSGGGSSGMVYAGSAQDKNLYFDGNGNFSGSSAAATAVIGSGIGGGTSRKSSGEGTYLISKGVLTLRYNNGKTELHSFFCRPGFDPVMAVIDGNVYFMEDEKMNQQKTNASSSPKRIAKSNVENAEKEPATAAEGTDAKAWLLKANTVHGGDKLDNIRTVLAKATLQVLQVSSFVDVSGKRIRLEVRQGGKLIQIEQMEGETGWQWRSGRLSKLPASRIAEMSSVFYSGILGLRKSQINATSVKNVKPSKSGLTIVCEQNGKNYAYSLSREGRLIASAEQQGESTNASAYTDFRMVNGVLLPFNETTTTAGQKQAIQYQSFEINQPFPESVWARP
jgi:hypothetical protein